MRRPARAAFRGRAGQQRAGAKQAVADLSASGGLRPIDAGPLRRARGLEGFQFLHMTLQQTLGTGWSSAIKIVS